MTAEARYRRGEDRDSVQARRDPNGTSLVSRLLDGLHLGKTNGLSPHDQTCAGHAYFWVVVEGRLHEALA